MSALANAQRLENLRTVQILTVLLVILTAVAAAAGLFIPGVYRDNDWVAPQNRGFDLCTLVLLPVISVTLIFVRRGSARASMILAGMLGYVFYTYTGGVFAYAFNQFYLVYLAIFSLSIAALVAIAAGVDAEALKRKFDASTPHGPVVGYLSLMAFLLSLLWLSRVIPALLAGTVPEDVIKTGAPTSFVFTMDLGLVVPLTALAAVWLWRRKAWGYFLTGVMLLKYTTMGLALVAASWYAHTQGVPTPVELLGSYGMIALGGIGMSAWFFRHCRDRSEA
ncbi:MAG TPA: hypothetical protein VD969_09560 [Symbiobacteriaceae bacterium]|nr:hypothetical protein [Symbiobacteriaceae bacterium]